MKVALVYDRVNKWGGAERVLLALNKIFPDSPLYTSVYEPSQANWAKVFPKVIPSYFQSIPFARTRHEKLACFMPSIFESFDFSKYDHVISVTSESAKGILTSPETKHICYCLTPTRYLWSGYKKYFNTKASKILAGPFVSYLRKWDKISSNRPDEFVAISRAVQKRIKRYYGKESKIIYPPVEIEKFYSKKKIKKDNYFLVVSRLVPYKQIDLAIKVFNQLKWPLVIVGNGSEEKNLKKISKSNIHFVHSLTDENLADYYRKAQALIFPQVEDFGLVSVEAQAAGTPVIAYKGGGALDTVVDSKTGIFFDKQTPESLKYAIKRFKNMEFKEKDFADNVEIFSSENFAKRFLELIS